jgi:hypothetical protein
MRAIIRVVLRAALAGLILMGCSVNEPDTPNEAGLEVTIDGQPLDSEFSVDSEFVEAVLADGRVTRDELEQAYVRKYRCLLDAGFDGLVAFDFDLWAGGEELGYYGEAYSLDAMSDSELEELVIRAEHRSISCSNSIREIEHVYIRDNPYDSPEDRERQRLAILACVRSDIPQVYADLDETWDYETLRFWLYEETDDYGASASVAATDCVNTMGAEWVPLRRAAGLE